MAALTQPARNAEIVDLDGDGDLDLLVAAKDGNRVVWYSNLGGSFGPEQLIDAPQSAAGRPQDAKARDFDGDGDADVVVVTLLADFVLSYENLGGGAFAPAIQVAALPARPEQVVLTDLNGDGDTDICVAAPGASRLIWYEGDGTGGFLSEQTIGTSGRQPHNVRTGDIDGDGVIDLALQGPTFSSIPVWFWLRGLGSGSYSAPIVIAPSGPTASGIRLADLDGDGDLDLLGARHVFWAYDLVLWLPNDGSGGFGPEMQVSADAAGYADDVEAADIDGDGDLDVLLTTHRDNRVVWFENTPTGFGPTRPITTFESDLGVGDMDADGDEDVVSLQALRWHENLGSGLGLAFCTPATPNATGAGAELKILGSDVVAEQNLFIRAELMAPGAFGMFLVSRTTAVIPLPRGSLGTLCLGGAIGRFEAPGQVQSANALGQFELHVDLSAIPSLGTTVAALAGETWYFQAWYRDRTLGGGATNLSEAASVMLR